MTDAQEILQHDSDLSDFKNLQQAWTTVQVVISTPRVTVGADFPTPDYFDRIYAYGTFRSCVPLLQMCGRCTVDCRMTPPSTSVCKAASTQH